LDGPEAKGPAIGCVKGNGAAFDGPELEDLPASDTIGVVDVVCVRDEASARNPLLEETAEPEAFAVWGTAFAENTP
jgi:hypothetical protein